MLMLREVASTMIGSKFNPFNPRMCIRVKYANLLCKPWHGAWLNDADEVMTA